MKAYYEHGGITIYHGDCREILPSLPRVDLLLTDPPYGIGADKTGHKAGGKHYWRDYGKGDWDNERPSAETFGLMKRAAKHHIIWGGNYFADYLPPTMGWLVWDKTQRTLSMADGELAWTSFNNAMRIFTANRVVFVQEGGRDHPTQKPVMLMAWAIAYADRHGVAQSILDPFVGSGTTLLAAKQLGRTAIGIELEERYCEIAAKRLQQECLFDATTLAPPPEPHPSLELEAA